MAGVLITGFEPFGGETVVLHGKWLSSWMA